MVKGGGWLTGVRNKASNSTPVSMSRSGETNEVHEQHTTRTGQCVEVV